MRERLDLCGDWRVHPEMESLPGEVARAFPSDGLPAQVPGTIHTDLLAAGIIPDPFVNRNEVAVQWVHDQRWRYVKTFQVDPQWLNPQHPIFLVFEGLDTIATVRLNGVEIASTDNMFLAYRFPVSHLLKSGENVLEVIFESPVLYARSQVAEYGPLSAPNSAERVYIRKAQYAFGWDWGPSLPTVGIWKPVYLERLHAGRLDHLRFHTLSASSRKAVVRVEVQLEWFADESGELEIVLREPGVDEPVWNTRVPINSNAVDCQLEIKNPRLWWPNGMGEPFRYKLEARLFSGKEVVDERTWFVGIRTVTLERQDDQGNPVFRFVVNGRPVYAQGANWIPADAFLPRVSAEKYRRLLQMARDAGMNMLRVWGGGVYETDVFYEWCDRLGLMVWQDFMFACGDYPEHQAFLENVRREARYQIGRLQHHPCLVIWCGNNENEWIWYQRTGRSPEDMPGYSIFHRLLPELCQQLDPTRAYWPSSPFGDDADPNDTRSGNRHQWNIWSIWQDYRTVEADDSLFVTEFGFQAPANRETLEAAIEPGERYPWSRTVEHHNKQEEGTERLFRFLVAHLPVSTRWEAFLYLTWLNQALALQTCVDHWRFRWPQTSGSLIWQLNDCWPVTSWALIDANLQPKAAYFAARRFFQKQRAVIQGDGEKICVRALNLDSTVWNGELQLTLFDLKENAPVWSGTQAVQLPAGQVLTVWERHTPISDDEKACRLWLLRLMDDAGEEISRHYWTYLPLKHLHLDPEGLQWAVEDETGEEIRIRLNAHTFVPGVFLEAPGVEFSDNWLDLFPGDSVQITGKRKTNSARPADVKVWCLNEFYRKVE
ncbi:MAG: glycoside hydrolase family 2 protein [Calditrichaeota bacterium]|nr:glycoside hydrolase family 2 protein [Calditrichota bacterium]